MPHSAIPSVFVTHGGAPTAVPVSFVTAANWSALRDHLDGRSRTFTDAAGFEPKAGRHLLLPGPDGGLAGVLFGLEPADDPSKDLFRPGALPGLLPAGTYRFANAPHDGRLAALAFGLGSYRFASYRKAEDKEIRLELPPGVAKRSLGDLRLRGKESDVALYALTKAVGTARPMPIERGG